MALESQIGEDGTVIKKGGLKIILDSQSAPLLNGTEVDYADSVQGSGFPMKNSQAKNTCSYGGSFTA